MEKQLFLELLYLKRKDSGCSISRKNSYNKLSTLISPRNAHQIIDKEDEKIITRDSSFIYDSINDKSNKINAAHSFTSEKTDYFTNKSQQYFDQKMREEIQKSIGKKIKQQKDKNINKHESISKIILKMQSSQKQCQLEKQKVKYELRKIIQQQQEDNYSKNNLRSQNNLNKISQNNMSNVFLKFDSHQKNETIQNKSSTSKQYQSGFQTKNQNQQLNQIINQNFFLKDKFQSKNGQQHKKNLFKQSYQNQTVLNSFSDLEQQNYTDYDNQIYYKQCDFKQDQLQSQNVSNILKIKSQFHKMYSKKGTFEGLSSLDDLDKFPLNQQQAIEGRSVINSRKPSIRMNASKQQQQQEQQKDYSLNCSYSQLNQFYNTNNTDKSNNNSYVFDQNEKKNVLSRKSTKIFQQDQLNLSTNHSDQTFKKQQTQYQSQKIEYFSQFNQILDNVEGVCCDLIDDAELYLDSTFIKSNLNKFSQQLQENKQVWLDDPKYIHVREKLRQNASKKRELQSENGKQQFHPYFQFLGYDNLEKIPKKRSKEEIIEQRYAYFLHKNGVNFTQNTIKNKQTNNDNVDLEQKLLQEKQENKKKMMDKYLTVLKQCKLKQKQYFREANQKQNAKEKNMTTPLNNSNLVKKQSNSSFIPLSSPRQEHRKYSFQDQELNKSLNSSKRQSFFMNMAQSPRSFLNQSPKIKTEDLSKQKSQTSEEFLKAVDSKENLGSSENINLNCNEKIGEYEEVPIVKQILSRYGRINGNDGDKVINQIKLWRKTEEQQLITNKEFFLSKLQEQKNKIGVHLEKAQASSAVKKLQTIEKIKKKFQSKQKANIEKLYRSEKEIEKNLEDLKFTTQNIDSIIQITRVEIHKFKQQNFNDLSIQIGGQTKLISSYAGQKLEYIKSSPDEYKQALKSFKTPRNYN
ncbi:hypothetical protein ABPG74_000327 [Tetrahymena malaccensis]